MVAGLVPQVNSARSSAANETRLDAVGPSPSFGREAGTRTDPVHCARVRPAARVCVSLMLLSGLTGSHACVHPHTLHVLVAVLVDTVM